MNLRACVFVYFLSPHRLLLTEQINKCNIRVQVSDGMLTKYFCMKYLCCHVIDNHSREPQAGKCAKERQLNRAKPREVKSNSYKLSRNQW